MGDFNLDEMIAAMKAFGDKHQSAARDVTMHPNDFKRLVEWSERKAQEEALADPPRPKLPPPFDSLAPLSSMPVYVDADVPEGAPEFNRPRKVTP